MVAVGFSPRNIRRQVRVAERGLSQRAGRALHASLRDARIYPLSPLAEARGYRQGLALRGRTGGDFALKTGCASRRRHSGSSANSDRDRSFPQEAAALLTKRGDEAPHRASTRPGLSRFAGRITVFGNPSRTRTARTAECPTPQRLRNHASPRNIPERPCPRNALRLGTSRAPAAKN